MNIIFVQSYPVYHDLSNEKDFLDLANRDKWMPSICMQKGYPSELWAAGKETLSTKWQYDDLPPLPVRIFKAEANSGKTKEHTSEALNEAARLSDASFFVIKGLDGGIGLSLIEQVLIPKNIPFALIIGGTWYHSHLKHAFAVFHETEWQKNQLTKRGLRFWRTVVNPDKLIRLEKSVDTRHFSPDATVKKEFDILSIGRLLPDYKNYDALFKLSRQLKIGVIGGGPMYEAYREKYPEISWFGSLPHHEIPSILNKGKLFFHSSLRDHFPRVISEAAACGIPPVAFDEVIHSDVIPASIGLRVSKSNYSKEIKSLIENKTRLKELSQNARTYAVENWNHLSSSSAIRDMMLLFKSSQKS